MASYSGKRDFSADADSQNEQNYSKKLKLTNAEVNHLPTFLSWCQTSGLTLCDKVMFLNLPLSLNAALAPRI